jgi:uncharacterized OB-fold protein
MSEVILTINIDTKCVECSKPGATPSGICMKCATKAMLGKEMKSRQGKVVAERYAVMRAKNKIVARVPAKRRK